MHRLIKFNFERFQIMLKYKLNPKIALFLMGILQFLIGTLFIYYHKDKIAIYTYFFFGVILVLGAIFIKTTHPVKIIQKANLDGVEKFCKYLNLALLAFSLLAILFDRTNRTSYIPQIDAFIFFILF